ncbi:hypothetical protein Taro_024730 [Colocasia esculenta]|uniref:Uncharacterized protein n=1 Tax=Colocasia esculenta TaxID=4460 RepID=A0A843V165_COLES|nr:hypothetical protein [Colocasia esculenta]
MFNSTRDLLPSSDSLDYANRWRSPHAEPPSHSDRKSCSTRREISSPGRGSGCPNIADVVTLRLENAADLPVAIQVATGRSGATRGLAGLARSGVNRGVTGRRVLNATCLQGATWLISQRIAPSRYQYLAKMWIVTVSTVVL